MILAIDPGNVVSAYVLMDKNYKIHEKGIVENKELLDICINKTYSHLTIEMIASYGMPVGKEIFETCVWIGRIIQVTNKPYTMIYRKEEKINLCGSMKAKDSNIRQALLDRFGIVGTKKEPGWFYGMKKDMWSAYAVGTTYLDMYINNKQKQ